jgi:ribonuclease P protein component
MLAAAPSEPVRVEMGWAIGRPVGTAVTRNRLRRRLRTLFASEQRGLPLPSGAYVVRADAAAATLTYAELAEHVRELSAATRRVIPA